MLPQSCCDYSCKAFSHMYARRHKKKTARVFFLIQMYSQWTSGCILVKSDNRKAACRGITYSSPSSIATAAQSSLFSVTWENKSTWDVQPSSATRDWARLSCSSSSTRGSSLAISQRAERLHSCEGSGSFTVTVTPFRCPRLWAESTRDLVPSRMTDLIYTATWNEDRCENMMIWDLHWQRLYSIWNSSRVNQLYKAGCTLCY